MSNMNGGVMKSQRARVGAGYQPPALPFAQLPNPDSVLGRVYIASDVGPAPGIELIAAPGRWRPRGGRQVLAMRSNNPVTIQDTAGAVAETIGPFPGGLVRAGMRLEVKVQYDHSGIGAGSRTVRTRIGSGATRNVLSSFPISISAALQRGYMEAALAVQSDSSAFHFGGIASSNSFSAGAGQNGPIVNFSVNWSADIFLISAAETAVNITSASWAAGVATFGTSAAHTLAVGDKTVIAGVTPSGYDVAAGAIVLSAPTTTSFTVAIASDPGAYTSGGTSSRISNMISQSYVLELVG